MVLINVDLESVKQTTKYIVPEVPDVNVPLDIYVVNECFWPVSLFCANSSLAGYLCCSDTHLGHLI